MAVSGLLALLDDITAILDDVAVLSKAAATKTAGIAGDDLAVSSQVVVGVDPKRELPIVWAVAKGSFKNKLFLIPGALAVNFVAPAAIVPILMAGGAFLCYEGAEKILHAKKSEEDKRHQQDLTAAAIESAEALMKLEREKIKGAINTDMILSGEIIAITLGTVASAPFGMQVAILSAIGIAMTVGIYGLVAGIVKLDDLGLLMAGKEGDGRFSKAVRASGTALVSACPAILKTISIVGTAAMLMVGGSLILHGIPGAEHFFHAAASTVFSSGIAQAAVSMVAQAGVGVAAGFLAIPAVAAVMPVFAKVKKVCAGIYAQTLKKSLEVTLSQSTGPADGMRTGRIAPDAAIAGSFDEPAKRQDMDSPEPKRTAPEPEQKIVPAAG